MRLLTSILFMLLSIGLIAQDNPFAKDRWQQVIAETNFSDQVSQMETFLKSGHWYEGVLVYKDGTAKEANILITSFAHLSMTKGRIKTMELGQVDKGELSYFIIDQFLWANQVGQWGVVQVKGPLTLFTTYSTESELPTTYLVDENGKWATAEDIEAGFRKKMAALIGDNAPLARKVESKEKGYRYSEENLAKIIHEYNEWVRVSDPDRYKKSVQLLANK